MSKPLYIKTPKGWWIRSECLADRIVLSYQERREQRGLLQVSLDLQGRERWCKPVHEVSMDVEWCSIGEVVMDERWDIGGHLLQWQDQRDAVQRHVTALIAAGERWGDAAEVVVGWFADPHTYECLVIGQTYEVIGSCDPLIGFEQMFLRIEADDEDDFLWIRFLDVDIPRIPIDNVTWVRALLIATHPIVE